MSRLSPKDSRHLEKIVNQYTRSRVFDGMDGLSLRLAPIGNLWKLNLVSFHFPHASQIIQILFLDWLIYSHLLSNKNLLSIRPFSKKEPLKISRACILSFFKHWNLQLRQSNIRIIIFLYQYRCCNVNKNKEIGRFRHWLYRFNRYAPSLAERQLMSNAHLFTSAGSAACIAT